ncbi:MAG TPA: zf-HC2 domain-containing protein [Pyrinomonadaceae bacterium]|nr:zf-HC2 domain-containing protein [Pyrinomonadaceae bacterium]
MLRCEDCIPLIEEYFDGEVDATVSEQMSAHISACADCAAALDALSFESEMYARYERGIEPTPALWARVSAEIARGPQPETIAERRPFLSRARASFAAALGALSMRPALASSLALLVVGVTAGSLWLANRPSPTNQTLVVATTEVTNGADVTPTPTGPPPPPVPVSSPDKVDVEIAANSKVAGPDSYRQPKAGVVNEEKIPSVDDLLNYQLPASINRALIDESHAVPDTVAQLVDEPRAGADIVNASAQAPGAGDKEMARHVEQTQMLLRSIKNARAGEEGGTVNVAYEKSLSRQLLADNATLKLEADVKGDKDTKQVLDTIEPFLLDIANMREQASREEVRSIRERVKKTEIIASLQVY